MPGKDGWIYDLVIARYINFIDLKNGNLDLFDLVKISDAWLIDLENQIRIKAFKERKTSIDG
jgi:hypothetical protein